MYTEETLYDYLWLQKLRGKSLRALSKEFGDVNHAVIQRCLRGVFPKNEEQRSMLNLVPEVTVRPVGYIENGAQAPASRQCACGTYFIPNHPKRRRCYSCSPIQRRDK